MYEEIPMYDFANIYREFLNDYSGNGWILNLDLDYFFSRQPESYNISLSDSYIEEIFTATKEALDNGKIKVLTIALSPEPSGGWQNAETLCAKLCKTLDVDFNLPE